MTERAHSWSRFIGIDFSGGSVVEVRAPQTSVEQLREGLRQQNFSHAAIQEFGEAGSYLIRLPSQSAEQVASGAPVEEQADICFPESR